VQFKPYFPSDRFVLLQELLGRTKDEGALGNVARGLAKDKSIRCLSTRQGFDAWAAHAILGGAHVYMPVVAWHRPQGVTSG